MTIYEGMFLLDNDLVRAGWPQAKSAVTNLIAKHGGNVHTARRWGERKLAYRVKRRNRATYLLTHFELPGPSMPAFQRDLEIAEPILRYLFLSVEGVPAGEVELARAEESADFVVPEPPADEFDEVEERPEPEAIDDSDDDGPDSGDDDDKDADAEPVAAGAGRDKKEG